MAEDPVAPATDAGFEVVRKGYEQGQVDAHLRRLDADVRILTTDRDAALDQAAQLARELDDSRARADRLRVQVRTLVSPQQSVQGMSERMRSMLRLAEDEVAEMLTKAETDVNKRVRAAEQRAAQLVSDAQNEAETIRGRTRAEATAADEERAQLRAAMDAELRQSRDAIAAAHAEAGREITRLHAEQEAEHRAGNDALATARAAAEQDRAQAWAASEALRITVEEDFTIAMNQRRNEALAALTAEQLATRRKTEELRRSADAKAAAVIADATATARKIVATAEHQIVELRALRGRVAEQLGGARAALDRTLGELGPLPGEEQVARGANGTPRPHPAAARPSHN